MKSLTEVKDNIAKDIFGETITDAQTEGICVNCKEPAVPKCYSEAGRREYKISGLCELCFDNIMGG